jgi:tetratricopeptide (TPR) repeat protein
VASDLGEVLRRSAELLVRGEAAEAVSQLRRASLEFPGVPEIHLNLTAAYRLLGREGDAEDSARLAVELRPEWPEAHFNLGNVRAGRGAMRDAIDAYGTAVALRADYAQALNGLGVAHLAMGEIAASIDAFARARDAAPQWPLPSYNLGRAAFSELDIERAICNFREAIRRDPEFAPAHLDLGVMLLLSGQYQEGWREYEWRWHGAPMPFDAHRLWDGSPLAGRTILIWQEQGFGDVLQLVRYVPLLARSGHVFILVRRPLERLIAGVEGVSIVLNETDAIPQYDVHLPLMSLPNRFHTSVETIPANVPYLRPAEAERARAASLVPEDGSLRVGVVWKSGAERPDHAARDCDPRELASLAEIEGVTLFNLQHGEPAQGLPCIDLSHETGDFADTAALVERMDVIVTVDTAMAHLACGLGRPTWILLNAHADWRWLRDRESSPWYPNARLFRQRSRGQWTEVIQRIHRAIAEAAAPRAR